MQSNFRADFKKFRPAQNILGPVKGQGISVTSVEELQRQGSTWSNFGSKIRFLFTFKQLSSPKTIIFDIGD